MEYVAAKMPITSTGTKGLRVTFACPACMVAVVSLTQAKELIPVLESLGYVYRPIDIVPERMFLRKESNPEYRTHHLNLTTQESGFWKNKLAFRDYLRAHDQIAAEYVELKKHLAEVYACTHEIDLDGKTA